LFKKNYAQNTIIQISKNSLKDLPEAHQQVPVDESDEFKLICIYFVFFNPHMHTSQNPSWDLLAQNCH
jgi:hypothetical protein